MPEYRIKDWKQLYENHRTRELRQMGWVPIPNKMDGIGYTELVEHPNGAAHFGAWIAIIEIASRQDARGTLPSVRGSTSIALSRLSRIPAAIFEEVLPRLLSPEIGWIEEVTSKTPPDTAQTPRDAAQGRAKPALYRTEGNGIEGNRTEGKAPADPTEEEALEFSHWCESRYARHPKKRDKFQSLRVLQRFCRDPVGRELFERHHDLYCATPEWTKQGGSFAPRLWEFVEDDGWRYPPIQPSKQEQGVTMQDLFG